MAQTIKLRRSATAGATPTTSQLELGEVAINTYDGKMYIKKSVGGTESIVSIGDGSSGIFEEFSFTASASQTSFSGNDDNSNSFTYNVGFIQVFLNGILLDPETDYTATNGTLVTLASAAAVNDYLQVFSFTKKISDGSVSVDTFQGNASTVAFTLSINPGGENNTRVFIDGVYQSKSNYSVSGTTLTFTTAPPSGTAIEIEIGTRDVGLDTATNLDFPDNVKLRLGTSQDLQIYHDASDSYITDSGTGNLKIQADDLVFKTADGAKEYLKGTANGSVRIRHNNSTKFETTSTGVDVTGNIAVSGTVDGVDIATRDGVLTSTTTTAGAALPKTGGAMTGAITTNSTFDGVDIAARDAVLTSTTTTASAALPKAGGTLTGNVALEKSSNPTFSVTETGAGAVTIQGTGSGGRVYSNSGNKLLLGANGQNSHLTIDTSGNVGIGTSSPGSFSSNASNLVVGSGSGTEGITINSGAANYGVIYFAGGTSGSAAYAGNINYNHADNSMRLGTNGSTTDVVIDSSGNVGIGTTSPDYALQVSGSNVLSGGGLATVGIYDNGTAYNGTNPGGGITFRGKYTSNSAITNFATVQGIKENATDGDYDTALRFTTRSNASNLTEKVRISSGGNVGIGTTSPTAPLSIRKVHATGYGSGIDMLDFKAYYPPNYDTETSKASIFVGTSDKHTLNTHGGYLAFRVNSSGFGGASSATSLVEYMRIEKDGNVGIGTDSPGVALDISTSTANTNGVVRIQNNMDNDYEALRLHSLGNYDAQMSFLAQGDSTYWGAFGIDYSDAGKFKLQTDNLFVGGSTLMTWARDGKVGIGTDSPSSLLNVHSSTAPKITISNGGGTSPNPELEFLRQSGVAARIVYEVANKDLVIKNDSTLGNIQFKQGSATQVEIEGSTGTVEVTNDLLANNAKLKAIAESKSVTAVDVFVYDTSKDSDGGAWRHRTQGTSWYNETLNTSTRGARKEFPSVAVIVAESNKVTIYDGDDPSMPMWMVFNVGGAEWATNNMLDQSGHNYITSVAMLNGFMVNVSDSSYGARAVDFLNDKGWYYSHSAYKERVYNGAIGFRNNGLGSSEGTKAWGVVSSYCNDVAMTVLPNAPIDADTGLPVPTIAIATDGGVSVIKDDGSVVDIYLNSAAYRISDYVEFTATDGIVFGQTHSNGAEQFLYKVNSIPASDTYLPYHDDGVSDLFMMPTKSSSNHASTGVDFYYLDDVNQASGHLRKSANKGRALSGKYGLTLLDENLTDAAKGSIAYITTDFNTGWMVGDTKLATLSDTDDTNAGSELGGLSTLSGTSRLASHTYTSGATTFSLTEDGNSSTSSGYVWLLLNLTAGKQYTVSIQCDTAFTATNETRLVTTDHPTGVFSGQGTTDLRHLTFGGTSSNTGLILYSSPVSGSTVTYTVSVKEAEPDRSVNNNGVQVFGTVTKTAVATGADLVGYSGFSHASGGNYLRKPYDSGLDLGTGDFVFSIWCKLTAASAQYDFLWEPQTAGSSNRFYILRNVSTGNLYLPYNTSVANTFIPLGVWTKVDIVRRSNVASQYINGIKAGISYISNQNLNASAASGNFKFTHIGCYHDGLYGWNGSIALARISATAPSEEQIKKMYNDEKFLFQENAKATLYGTSDAVTALAYDDDTELLHAGTSAGRSEFQGLRRVNNTTDAVGAAISASNGFIVEE